MKNFYPSITHSLTRLKNFISDYTLMSSFSSTVQKLQAQLNRINPNEPFDEEEVREMLFDAIFTQISDQDLDTIFDAKTQQQLEHGKLTEEQILLLVSQKLPNFEIQMKELAKQMYEEYLYQ